MGPKNFDSDFLVIGSGIAGLTFAIKASKFGTVNIVTKKKESDSSTNYAQGGIAAVLSPEDSFESHISDTMKAGAGLCNRKAVEILVKNGPERVKELIKWGTDFSTKQGSDAHQLDLGREGGHSRNRIAHSRDLTGQEIERALIEEITRCKDIGVFENYTAIDLLTEHQLKKKKNDGVHCYGAYILDNNTGIIHTFRAKQTFLATGGAGQAYLHTTNPSIATGDGIAMAYRAGAFIADMEFMQFHPTSLYSAARKGRTFLISEAVRGEGAVLLNSSGKAFMAGKHPMKDLAPRDIVARAIDSELKRLGDEFVYLDVTFKGKEFLLKRFPAIYAHCLEQGIDIASEPIPVVPAAHYLCGGIITDTEGRTSIHNLYAAGECSCTGVHGANRLASNSLLEGVVFSNRAAEDVKGRMEIWKKIVLPQYPYWDKEGTFDLSDWILVNHNIEDVKRLMWDYVGIVRTDLRLQKAYGRIIHLAEEIHDYYKKSTVSSEMIVLRNLATVAKLIIKGAMNRKGSIGLHYNADHPEESEESLHVVQRSEHEPLLKELH